MLPEDKVLQGNLCPLKLAEGTFEADLERLLDVASSRPVVINLGHGIRKETPLDHVYRMTEMIRGYGR